MTQKEIENIVNEIYRLTDSKLFALSFQRLKILLKELQQWWAISSSEELETLCGQMLRYSLGDYEDPQRSQIIHKLQSDIYLLVDDIFETLTKKNLSIYTYEQKKFDTIAPSTWSEVANQLQITELPYDEQKTNSFDWIFRRVWLNGRISSEEYTSILQFLNDISIESSARQLILSALMLKGLRHYDASVIKLLIIMSKASEPQLRARAIVGLLMLISYSETRISRDSEIVEKIKTLFDDEDFSSDAEKAYRNIINTFGTDKVTKKITTEIYPEIFKSGAKFQQMLKEEGTDILNDEEFNPKWEKALMDDEGVSAKLREFGDMQMQGADVYMSTFSSMKGYPFFNEIPHWFMPFDVKQQDVARQMADMPDVLRFFSESTHICSSDKYSFFYSIAQIPAANFKSMMTGMGADAETVKDELSSEEWKNNNANQYAVEVRNYVLDIFRFYRLFSRCNDLVNPFDFVDKFNKFELIFDTISLQLKKSICKYLFEVEHFAEARRLFEYLDSQQVWDAYFYQQMGHCYQQLEQWSDALACYEKADLLEANDIWTLKRKALCYRRLQRFDDAANCYELILQIKEDDISTMLNLANYYLQVKDYTKARSLFYKVEYLRPNNYKAQSGIAWTLFVEADYDKAVTYYDTLSKHKDFTSDDALNAGHTFWALGAKDIAREHYRRAKQLINNDIKFSQKLLDDAEYLKRLGLSDEDIIILINQILF